MFFSSQKSLPLRGDQLSFFFLFFSSSFWHNSTAGNLPRHVGECAARGLRGKIQSWMEIFKGPRIPLKLALSLSHYPIEEMLHT